LEPGEAEKLGITANYVFVAPNGEELRLIAQLVEQNRIIPLPIEEMPLQEAGLAQEKLRSGAVFGKIVLKI
jgi:NADPH:quinone reductase-like Zn-dependent oxidoreductase